MFILNVAEICIAIHKGTTIAKVDDGLSKALKHMPNKKGGTLVSGKYMCMFLYIK